MEKPYDVDDPKYAGGFVEGVCPACSTPHCTPAGQLFSCENCGHNPFESGAEPQGDGLEAMTKKALAQIIADEQVTVDPKARQSDMVAAIRAARAAKAADTAAVDPDNGGEETPAE